MRRGLLADCEEHGYKIAYQSEVPPEGEKGYFIPLTILDNPPDECRVVREEREWNPPPFHVYCVRSVISPSLQSSGRSSLS